MKTSPAVLLSTLLLGLLLPRFASAAESQRLFANGQTSVTFKLQDPQGKTPVLMLFDGKGEEGTAESINYWRGTVDPKVAGVVVEFKALRFIQAKGKPNELVVRLVGIKNEFELGETISLSDLEQGKPKTLHFGPVAMGLGPISGTTTADLTLSYDPSRRVVAVPSVAGEFEWKRPFHAAQKDAGSITLVTGEVGDVPPGGNILKPTPVEAKAPRRKRK